MTSTKPFQQFFYLVHDFSFYILWCICTCTCYSYMYMYMYNSSNVTQQYNEWAFACDPLPPSFPPRNSLIMQASTSPSLTHHLTNPFYTSFKFLHLAHDFISLSLSLSLSLFFLFSSQNFPTLKLNGVPPHNKYKKKKKQASKQIIMPFTTWRSGA